MNFRKTTILTSLPLQLYWTLRDKSRPPNTLTTIYEESLLLSERKQRSIREVMIYRLRWAMMSFKIWLRWTSPWSPPFAAPSLSLETLLEVTQVWMDDVDEVSGSVVENSRIFSRICRGKGVSNYFWSRPFSFFFCRPCSISNSRYRCSKMIMRKFLRSNLFSTANASEEVDLKPQSIGAFG